MSQPCLQKAYFRKCMTLDMSKYIGNQNEVRVSISSFILAALRKKTVSFGFYAQQQFQTLIQELEKCTEWANLSNYSYFTIHKCPNKDQKKLRIWILFTQCMLLKRVRVHKYSSDHDYFNSLNAKVAIIQKPVN